MDAKRLEGSGRRMDGEPRRFRSLRRGYNLGELESRRQGTGGDDSTCDTTGIALFAKARDHLGQFLFAGGVRKVCGACAIAAHAHVERTLGTKGEAALRFVELEGG